MCNYLAHVWRAEIPSMRAHIVGVERENPKPSLLINKARVGVDLREAISNPMMIQNRLDEERVRIAKNPQIAPESTSGLDGGHDSRMNWSPFEDLNNVFNALSLFMNLLHHRILQIFISTKPYNVVSQKVLNQLKEKQSKHDEAN